MTRGYRCATLLLLASSAALAQSSLYDEQSFRPLTHDRRAQRVGDSLTILIYESSSASQNAQTELAKEGGLDVALELDSVKASGKGRLRMSEDHNGKGKIARSGKLAAQITVSVQSIASNGDLQVAGKQRILINDEEQQIILSGRVRPEDISETNSVVSTRLADASISYLGKGALAEKQRPGIISRILSWLGLI